MRVVWNTARYQHTDEVESKPGIAVRRRTPI